MQFRAIVGDTIREMRVKKLFGLTLLFSTVMAAAMACVGFDEHGMTILGHRLDGVPLSTQDPLYRSTISFWIVMPYLISVYIGWIATILALFATAGVFPSLMEKGAIDCLLARPISRWKLFSAKYVGALSFMAIQAFFFVTATFFIMGVRWRVWYPGYLWCIPLLIVLFSYLFCVTVAFGVWTRSGLASFLLTLAFWFMASTIQTLPEVLRLVTADGELVPLKKTLQGLKWLFPKTADIPALAERLMDATDPTEHLNHPFFLTQTPGLSREDRQRVLQAGKEAKFTRWSFSLGSSLVFEAIILGATAWRFSKKDF